MIGLGTPMVLFAEALGASALQVGLASSFLYLVLPVQVLATASLARLGYKRQMVMGWWIRALFLLVPLGLALYAPQPPASWMADLFVASVLGFCLLRAFGTAAHLPWMAAILPVEVRGRFFATDHMLTSGLGVGTLLPAIFPYATADVAPLLVAAAMTGTMSPSNDSGVVSSRGWLYGTFSSRFSSSSAISRSLAAPTATGSVFAASTRARSRSYSERLPSLCHIATS